MKYAWIAANSKTYSLAEKCAVFEVSVSDEDAAFRLNRRAGTYSFQNSGSIKLHSNGIYPLKELRVACGQLLTVLRDGSVSYRLKYLGKDRTGIDLTYSKSMTNSPVFFRDTSGNLTKLESKIIGSKRSEASFNYKFSDEIDGEIITETAP